MRKPPLFRRRQPAGRPSLVFIGRAGRTACVMHRNRDTVDFNQFPAEQLFWLHWTNIFTARKQQHEETTARYNGRCGGESSPVAQCVDGDPSVISVARNIPEGTPLFPPLPPVQISKIEYLFQAALCLGALVVKPVTAAIPPFPPCLDIDLCSLLIAH